MSDGIPKTLAISAKGLPTPITLLLTFSTPDPAKSDKGIFPTCWKVIHLKKGDFTEAEVVARPNLAFTVLQKTTGNFVDASSSARCNPGQKCTIVNDGVTPAVPGGESGILTCLNETKFPVNVSLGFCDSDGSDIEPVLFWNKVAHQSEVVVKFVPSLEIYLSVKDNQILGNSDERPLLWKRDLDTLGSWTNLRVTVDDASGKISISDDA